MVRIVLTSQQEQLIQQQLASGKYQSIDDVIEQALQLLQARDEQARLQSRLATDLSQFVGVIQLTEDPLQFQQQIRDEW